MTEMKEERIECIVCYENLLNIMSNPNSKEWYPVCGDCLTFMQKKNKYIDVYLNYLIDEYINKFTIKNLVEFLTKNK